MTNKIYDGELFVEEEDKKVLKRIFVNHLLIYNYSLGLLYDNPELRFEVLSRKVVDHIKQENVSPILRAAVHNEIYYQYKKFRRNVKVQKQLTDLQYFTFTVTSYNNTSFTMNKELDKINILGVDLEMELESQLPELGSIKMLYFNISYSSMIDKFMLSVHSVS